MAFTSEERQVLVQRYWDSERKTGNPDKYGLTINQIRREDALQKKLLEEYGENLPTMPLSRCPVCESVLEYSFDAYGLDGMWWSSYAIAEGPAAGESHFGVLLGAIDFQGREPLEAAPNDRVHPGPGAPFVVPRLFEELGMLAVISSFKMPLGDLAYVIAYYSEAPFDPYRGHQPWARESFSVFDEDGVAITWGAMSDLLDFEIQPWIDKGLVRWINPGDETLTLCEVGDCPYVGLPGVRVPQLIEDGRLRQLPLPDGELIDPFG